MRVIGLEGQSKLLTVVVDTGFTDYLLLPADTIRDLRLVFRRYTDVLLADEIPASLNVYSAMADLDGETFEIDVYEAEGEPLAGMALLTGCRLSIHATTDGEVTVEKVP